MNIKQAGSNDSSNGKFDHVARAIQDIRELRERHDREQRERQASRFSPDRLARSADADIPPEESLPLFLSTPDYRDSRSTDQDGKRQDAERQDSLHQDPDTSQQDCLDQASRRQKALHQDLGYQDWGHPDLGHQDVRHQSRWDQDDGHQDDWQQAALEADRERMDAVVSSTITKRALKKGILAMSVLSALIALFILEDHHTLIANTGASPTAVLPTTPSSGGPALAPEKIAGTPPVPVTTVAAAPTREAIAAAYQTVLQSQPPEIRQPSDAPDGETLFKQFLAWEAAQNAKAQAGRPAQ